jgi:hypothetical protein
MTMAPTNSCGGSQTHLQSRLTKVPTNAKPSNEMEGDDGEVN